MLGQSIGALLERAVGEERDKERRYLERAVGEERDKERRLPRISSMAAIQEARYASSMQL